jgi:thiazolinyl imide reductase
MGRIRVLLGGANYARAYLRAVQQAPDAYEVVGVLARGSDRARQTADELDVPMITDPGELPMQVDMACTALGRDGSTAILELLGQGIHVLCEHPQSVDFVQQALEIGASSGARFHVNGHFADLEATQTFVGCWHTVRQTAELRFLQLVLADRFLYAVVDILKRGFGRLEPVTVEHRSDAAPFTLVQCTLGGGAAATFCVQRSESPDGTLLPEGSPEYLVAYRIVAGFDTGLISLLSVGGPVVWNSNEPRVGDPDLALWHPIHTPMVTGRALIEERVGVNLAAMNALVEHAGGGDTPPAQTREYLEEVSRTWETLGRGLVP